MYLHSKLGRSELIQKKYFNFARCKSAENQSDSIYLNPKYLIRGRSDTDCRILSRIENFV